MLCSMGLGCALSTPGLVFSPSQGFVDTFVVVCCVCKLLWVLLLHCQLCDVV